MDEVGIPYESVRGEAAFYGPKIDFQVSNVIGREETASTNQLDLVMAERFGLTYRDQESVERAPMIIHRAPLGITRRFVLSSSSIMAESFQLAGTGSGAHHSGGFRIFRLCRKIGKGVEIKIHPQSSRPIDGFFEKRSQQCVSRFPNLLILGEQETLEGSVTWQRCRPKTDQARFVLDAVRGRNPQPQRLAHRNQLNLSNRFHSDRFDLLQDPKPQRVHTKPQSMTCHGRRRIS